MKKAFGIFFSHSKVLIGEWFVKASVLNENILVFAFNKYTDELKIRSFNNEHDAMLWVEYIVETN
jgi:hypothetical protein